MRVILTRHTQTDFNIRNTNGNARYSGQLDIPLNRTGVLQAQAMALALADENVTCAFSSDLIRAVQTMRIIVAGRNIDLSTSELLRELDVGVAGGLTRDETLTLYKNEVLNTRHPKYDFSSIGGESRRHMLARYHQFFVRWHAEVTERGNTGGVGLVVCHGTALRDYLASNPKLKALHFPEQGECVMIDDLAQFV